MPQDSDAGAAQAREDLCRYLSACYYEPDPAFVEEGLFESIREAAARLDPTLAEPAAALGADFAAHDLQTLLVDYTRLFIGPVEPRARPYGSVWLEREDQLMQASTMDVLDAYRAGGFEVAEDFRELPDHVAVELEFLYVLIFRENAARRDGRPADLLEADALRRGFLGRHLGRWVGPFAQACQAGAECGFYRELAELTRRFVALEQARPAPG